MSGGRGEGENLVWEATVRGGGRQLDVEALTSIGREMFRRFYETFILSYLGKWIKLSNNAKS